MAKQREFDDPLKGLDPIMEQAFSNPGSSYDSGESQHAGSYYEASTPSISRIQFPELKSEGQGRSLVKDLVSQIPITVSVELGRSKISMKEIYELSEGSIVELDRLVGQPLDLVVNGQTIAQGEVVAIDNNYGLRLTNIFARPK